MKQENTCLLASQMQGLTCKGSNSLKSDYTEVVKRLQAVKGLQRLTVSNSDHVLAMALFNRKAIPQKAFIDAVHVALGKKRCALSCNMEL